VKGEGGIEIETERQRRGERKVEKENEKGRQTGGLDEEKKKKHTG